MLIFHGGRREVTGSFCGSHQIVVSQEDSTIREVASELSSINVLIDLSWHNFRKMASVTVYRAGYFSLFESRKYCFRHSWKNLERISSDSQRCRTTLMFANLKKTQTRGILTLNVGLEQRKPGISVNKRFNLAPLSNTYLRTYILADKGKTMHMFTTKSGSLVYKSSSRVKDISIELLEAGEETVDGIDLCCIPVTIEALEELNVEELNHVLGDEQHLQFLKTGLNFKGKLGESKVTWKRGKQSVVFVGCGSKEAFDEYAATLVAQSLASKLSEEKEIMTVGLLCGSWWPHSKPLIGIIAESLIQQAHVDCRFKTKGGNPSMLNSISFIYDKKSKPEMEPYNANFAHVVKKAKAVAEGSILCKELVNAPANIVTPTMLSQIATSIAEESDGYIDANILEKSDCEALGMGAYLAVSKGSILPPKFIHMVYMSNNNTSSPHPVRKIAVIGKGLTFDSGGYNIKSGPFSLIELMKFDMGGAASVLGCAKAVSMLKPEDIEVHFIIAACENMISGSGLHPGDIVKASNGTTIEVNNTDAEGRLTLADAIVYAQNQGVKEIVDVATLTGACIVALGDEIGGLFSPSDPLAGAIERASRSSGELVHRMPMHRKYLEQLKSNVADLKNTGKGGAGSITAALFLNEFVQKGTQWAHLDIAGPVWNSKKEEATGYGVSTLVEWILQPRKDYQKSDV